jgi:hypothetical protein
MIHPRLTPKALIFTLARKDALLVQDDLCRLSHDGAEIEAAGFWSSPA